MISAVALTLLSLLGAAALAAPVAKDDHVEEMVTRCIVEVLLNGLSKPNAPPIDPLCRELLKKRNQWKHGERNGDKDINFGLRQLSESEELEKLPGRTVKEDDLNEEEFKKQAGGGQKWNSEEGKHEENQHVLSQGSPNTDGKAHEEEKKNDDEKNGEEDGSKRNNHGEEGNIEKKHNEEVAHELLDKSSFPTAGRDAVNEYKRQRHSEENTQSQGKGNQASEQDDREEEEEESSEKYHHSLHREYEDSFEREEADADKRGHQPKHYYRKPWLGNASENKRHHNEEKEDSPEESSEEETNLWAKRNHYPKHHRYETGHHYEKRNSNERQDSEEMKGRSRSKEYQDRWQYSKEDDEEADMRHHSMENEEKQPHHERKSPQVESQKEMRYYEERKLPSKTIEKEEGRQHNSGRRDEKMHQNNRKRHFQWEETPKPQSVERGQEEPDLYSPEEGFNFNEEKRYYSEATSEEEPDNYHSEEEEHGTNKRTLLVEEGYPRSHYLVENVKRAAPSFIPYYQQLRWKNRHMGKKDDIGDPFLESAEEPRSQLKERDFVPEYDYDYWEKKQLMDSLNPRHKEHNLEQKHKFDMKRQYNRMDELAHLLNYRKKSAEFPELYDSKEDVKRSHVARGEGKLSQRPLTPQEEKELENLAAMDLELQKIAEKFSNNQRG